MNRQSDVIENWEYGLLTLLNNALNLPVSEKNDAIEVKSIIEDVSRKLDSDSIQKFNEYSEDEWNKIIKTADGHGVLPLILWIACLIILRLRRLQKQKKLLSRTAVFHT